MSQLERFTQLEARTLADLRRFRDAVVEHPATNGLSLDHKHDLAALIAKTSPGIVAEMCTALDSGRPDQVAVRIAAELQSLRRADPDLFLASPLRGYLLRLMQAAGPVRDRASNARTADVMYCDAARRLQYHLRAKLRATGRPVPEPRPDDNPVAQNGRYAPGREHHEAYLAKRQQAADSE